MKLNLKPGRTGNLDGQGFVVRLSSTREPSKKILPFGQNLITSAALKAAPTYNEYYDTAYYESDYEYNEVEVEEYYYEGIISTFISTFICGNPSLLERLSGELGFSKERSFIY